jgi:F-type H+-transporting ATPase subunit delta
MSSGKIAVRYAKALFEAARETGKSEVVYLDVKLLFDTCSIPEFSFMLDTPVAKPSQKISVFKALFDGKIDILTLDFLELLAKNKRELYLKNISRSYLALHQKYNNIKPVRLISATTFDSKQISELTLIVEKKLKSTIELTQKVDPTIIGGFILQIENTQYDASITSKLSEIKRSLLNTNIQQ